MKEDLIKLLEAYKPKNENIEIKVYNGYSFLHIDISGNGLQTLFTTLSFSDDGKPLDIKLCGFDERCTETTDDFMLIKELEEIAKYIGANKIYGRAKILKSKKRSEDFYTENGYSFDFKKKDKPYLSAIISKEF